MKAHQNSGEIAAPSAHIGISSRTTPMNIVVEHVASQRNATGSGK
jgi:hypothetical protein